jgi:hypothetical protein
VVELAEVLPAEPIEGGAVELGRTTDEIVDLGLERLPLRVVPRVGRDVPVLDEDALREPVLQLAGKPPPALEQENAFPRGGEVAGEYSFNRSMTMMRAAASISARCEKACGKLPR